MMTSFGWAKFPMVKRVTEIDQSVPMTMVYGSRSWIDSNIGYEVKFLRSQSDVEVQVNIKNAHHIWAASHKKVPNVLSRCHTKRRMGARGRAHPSYGMTTT